MDRSCSVAHVISCSTGQTPPAEEDHKKRLKASEKVTKWALRYDFSLNNNSVSRNKKQLAVSCVGYLLSSLLNNNNWKIKKNRSSLCCLHREASLCWGSLEESGILVGHILIIVSDVSLPFPRLLLGSGSSPVKKCLVVFKWLSYLLLSYFHPCIMDRG